VTPSFILLVLTHTGVCRFYTASQSYAHHDLAQIPILMNMHHRAEPSASIWQRVILARLTHSFSKTHSCLWCVVSSLIFRRPSHSYRRSLVSFPAQYRCWDLSPGFATRSGTRRMRCPRYPLTRQFSCSVVGFFSDVGLSINVSADGCSCRRPARRGRSSRTHARAVRDRMSARPVKGCLARLCRRQP